MFYGVLNKSDYDYDYDYDINVQRFALAGLELKLRQIGNTKCSSEEHIEYN